MSIDDEKAIESDVTEAPRKLTLGDLLALTREADDALDDCDLDLESLGKDLKTKIDNIGYLLEALDMRAEAAAERGEILCKRAKALKNKAKSIRERVAFQMEQDIKERGLVDPKPKLSGLEFEVLLKYSESVEIKGHPDAKLYLKLGPKFIRREYEFDKPTLKKALKENNQDILNYASIVKTPYITIKPKS